MQEAKNGDTVRVHYTGRLDDGTVFDTSKDREPLEFIVGRGHVITGFEGAVTGMSVGEIKSVRIPADEAYGICREDLIARVPRDKFPAHITPEVGLHLQLKQPDGMILNVLIADITDDEIMLDANHPFAGKDLNFEIELVEIGVLSPGDE